MFRMCGRIVELLHYKVDYITIQREELQTGIKESEVNEYRCFTTKEEADLFSSKVNGTVSELPTESDAWMDGIEVADVPDTYAEALRILDIGKEAYEKEKQDAADKDSLTWDVLASAIKEGVVQVD